MSTPEIVLSGYLRPPELAAHLHIPGRTIRSLQARGILPYVKLSKKCTLFRLADVEKALDRFEVHGINEVQA